MSKNKYSKFVKMSIPNEYRRVFKMSNDEYLK